MANKQNQPRLLPEATAALVGWRQQIEKTASSPLAAAQKIAVRLGAQRVDGQAYIGFWAPEIGQKGIPDDDVFLEILTPPDSLDLTLSRQRVVFRRQRVSLVRQGEYLWGVIAGMRAGTKERIGDFYRLKYRAPDGRWLTIPDYLAASIPFGAFAPAEFYDLGRLDREREDRAYFARLAQTAGPDGLATIGPPVNILQIHANTGSAEGTLAGLARIYQEIGAKIDAGQPLTPAEQCYAGYDAVQLMPIEPIVEYEAGPPFWQEQPDHPDAASVTVNLSRPDMTNWGYDVVVSASSAVNPAALGGGRPDELVELAVALHNFPGRPIKLIFDVVYGHADNQALPLLDKRFLAGPNMYGQDMNYRHPIARAILLEMQRRKNNLAGADGLRVDGAQDFKVWDAEAQELRHDDDYLQLMSDVTQEVAGCRYKPWMIFEDGRPWPREDWELASSYRAVIERQPEVFQWGPLIFAHNTPFLFTFWISKWWRIQEMATMGANWLSGYANHDTVRRGTQVDPEARVNSYLGRTLPEILRSGYDNAAATLFTYAFLPGVPMDFINASMRAPWSFIRNTDDRWAVKVAADEARFLDWQVDDAHYEREGNFIRLKGFGFDNLAGLRRFMNSLAGAAPMTNYDLEGMARLLAAVVPPLDGPPLKPQTLKAIARAWMDDLHDYCNVSLYHDELDPALTAFNLAAREFRRQRPWLRRNLGEGEFFDRRRPAEGTVLFYGLRRERAGREQLLFVANMEGAPAVVVPLALPIPDLPQNGWRPALVAPGLEAAGPDQPLALANGQAAVWVR